MSNRRNVSFTALNTKHIFLADAVVIVVDDLPPLSVKDLCKHWEVYGFDCVDKDVCSSDGHYDSLPIEIITGIRSTETDFTDYKEVFLQYWIHNRCL